MNQDTPYLSIIYISIFGFFLTGILAYPYGINWDNSHVYYNLDILNNWMGWFYPSLWQHLINIMRLKHCIGLLHNIFYWIGMPLIYINFISAPLLNKNYHYNYIIFAFCPSIVIFLTNITNNVLLLSFLALAIGSYTVFRKNKSKIFFLLSIILLIVSTFIRRDAIIISIPLLAYFLFTAFRSKIYAFLACILCIAATGGVNYLAKKNIKDYDSTINSIELITIYDITGMSYYKKELLIPDEILKEEYRGSNRSQVMEAVLSSTNIHIDFITFEYTGVNHMLLSGTSWKSGLTLKKALPIYMKNIPYYLFFRLKTMKRYLVEMNSLYEPAFHKDILDREGLPKPPFNIIGFLRKVFIKATEIFLMFFFLQWFYFFLSIFSLYLLHSKRFSTIYPPQDRSFCTILIIIGCMGSLLSMISAVSIQLRYLMPANFLIWIAFIFSIQNFFDHYKILLTQKKENKIKLN